jgi:nitrite reductase/ring-hydroxylating ferredoxin subunit
VSASRPLDLPSLGPGSPLGDYFRRFWLPICPISDLPPGAERPVRAQLLDDRLVGFRDGQARLGLIYGLCTHARGDMFYSAIEEDGIRCNYHGWKFDVHGVCLETPMHPVGSGIDTLAFPVAEHAGLIWGYLGEDQPPALPDVASTAELQTERRVRPWLEAVVSELLASAPADVAVQFTDDSVRAGEAIFTPPYLITRDSSGPTFVLPASEKATHLLGGTGGSADPGSEAGAAVRAAIEELLRQVIARDSAQSRSP